MPFNELEKLMRLILTLLATVVMTTACNAGDADIKKNLETRFPGAKVTSISKTPVKGLYEVVVDGNQLLYSDDKANYVVLGELLETQSKRNLTKERMDKLMEVKFDSLPFNQAIKIVKGDGKRRLAVFSDVDCPYCRKLEPELNKLDNVTIYNFAYPLPFHTDAARKSRLIWCSPDPAKAWQDLMLNGKLPEGGKDDCPNPIDANLELGRKLNVEGTPAIIFSNGKRAPGYLTADKIEQMLRAAESGK
jgi:thiol:disulfide interchange protein DsbC